MTVIISPCPAIAATAVLTFDGPHQSAAASVLNICIPCVSRVLRDRREGSVHFFFVRGACRWDSSTRCQRNYILLLTYI